MTQQPLLSVPRERFTFATLLLCLAGVLAGEILFSLLYPGGAQILAGWLMSGGEASLLEGGTVIAYLAASVLVWQVLRAPISIRAACIVLILMLVLRELDLDSRYTETSAMRTKFLFSSNYPAGQRLVAGTIIGLGVLCGVYLVIRCTVPFLRSLFTGHPAAWTVTIGFFCLPIAKLLDGAAQDLRRLVDIPGFSSEMASLSSLMEETLELFGPLCVIAALVFHMWRSAHLWRDPARTAT